MVMALAAEAAGVVALVVAVVDFLPVCSPAGLPVVVVAEVAEVVEVNTPALEKVLTNGRI